MIGDQALRLVDQLGQLPHGSIALSELLQEPPPHRMSDQSDERRRVAGFLGDRDDTGLHVLTIPITRQINQTSLM
jgi:hypothetical protein